MGSDSSDSAIIEGYIHSDKDAAAKVESYIEAAYRSWQHKFGYEADDIRSDVQLKLLLSFRQEDFRIQTSLQGFIKQVVNHTCIDYYRYSRRRTMIDINDLQLADGSLSAEERLEKNENARLSFRALRLMSKECIQLWRMHLKDGLTCGEIGKKLGKTEETVRWKLFDCRKRVRKIRDKIKKDANDPRSGTPHK